MNGLVTALDLVSRTTGKSLIGKERTLFDWAFLLDRLTHGVEHGWVDGLWHVVRYFVLQLLYNDWKSVATSHFYNLIKLLFMINEPPYTRSVRTVV